MTYTYEQQLIKLINQAERKVSGHKTGSQKKNWVMYNMLEYDKHIDVDTLSEMIDLLVSLSKIKHMIKINEKKNKSCNIL